MDRKTKQTNHEDAVKIDRQALVYDKLHHVTQYGKRCRDL